MLPCNILSKGVPLLRINLPLFIKKVNITNSALKNFGMHDRLYKTVELEVKSFEPAVLRSYISFIKTAAQCLNINVERVEVQKKPNYKRFTVLKSIFGHAKHMVQYEIRTHYQWVYLQNLTGSTADTFLEYLERMLPEGVGLKVTKISLEPLPDHLNVQQSQETLQPKEEA